MVELQLLNTLLFSDNVNNLKKAINTLNDPNNSKQGGLKTGQVTNILSYAMLYNPKLNEDTINKALTEAVEKAVKYEKE
ncbi:MAG: hypothetical protein LN568_04390 [Rickettsia endosymbiont of Pseudomimeciton antennatum]|nr:hypothetical protein [Rickettsia endosymbiont of Pseudomimeciton antennatum]MCC8398349.1 hypothetical protein [Rickettsia endosymbiont of Labidopullus appendiculatus]